MRDPDETMAYEAKQQELVEGIVRSLHHATRSDDSADGYVLTFCDLGLMAVYSAVREIELFAMSGLRHMFIGLVKSPIEQFTTVPEERKVLLMRVGMKLLESPRVRAESALSRQQFAAELETTSS